MSKKLSHQDAITANSLATLETLWANWLEPPSASKNSWRRVVIRKNDPDEDVTAHLNILPEDLADDEKGVGNLGPVPRYKLIVDFLAKNFIKSDTQIRKRNKGEKDKGPLSVLAVFGEAHKRGIRLTKREPSAKKVRPGTLRQMTTILSLLNGYDNLSNRSILPAIEHGFADMVIEITRNPDMTHDQLFKAPYVGKGALDAYRANFDTGVQRTLHWISQSDNRTEFAKDIIHKIVVEPAPAHDHLDAQVLPLNAAGQEMLINIYGDGQWRDLAALAQKIEADLDAHPQYDRPVIRIPLGAYAQDKDENPNPFTLSFDGLLQTLVEKLFPKKEELDKVRLQDDDTGGDEQSIDLSSVHRSAKGINSFALIRAIRLKLAKEPHVLIFDTYYETATQGEDNIVGLEILRIARDDHLKNLLTRLIEPPIMDASADTTGPLDILTYQKNRFVVFSNRKLSYFAENREGEKTFSAKKIPYPNEEEMAAVLSASHLNYRAEIANHWTRTNAWRDFSHEPFFDLLNAYLTLKHGPDPKAANTKKVRADLREVKTKMPGGLDNVQRIDWLMRKHMQLMSKENSVQFQLHLLISIVPCGLRHLSIARIARRIEHLKLSDSTGAKLSIPLAELFTSDLSKLRQAAATFHGGLLCEEMADVFLAYDEAPDIFETTLLKIALSPTSGLKPLKDQTSEHGFDFHDPIMKESLYRCLDQYLEPMDVALLNRMLSEEALSQQNIANRYRGTHYTPSIRALRRQISGLYHGLLSLHVEEVKTTVKIKNQEETVHSLEFKTSTEQSCIFLAGPMKQLDFYKWLYLTQLRAVIEAPPSWRLTRFYALDRLKLDLLDGFDRPIDLLGAFAQNPREDQSVSLIKSVFHATHPEVVEDYWINVSHASTGINRTDVTEDSDNRRVDLAGERRKNDEAARLREKAGSPYREYKRDAAIAKNERHLEVAGLRDRLNNNILKLTMSAEECEELLWCLTTGTYFEAVGDKQDVLDGKYLKKVKDKTQKNSTFFNLRSGLSAEIEMWTNAYLKALKKGGKNTKAPEWPEQHKIINDIAQAMKREPEMLSNFADSLFRISEMEAIEADLVRYASQFKTFDWAPAKDVLKAARKRWKDARNDNEQITSRLYCRSLAIYKFAEAIRDTVQSNNPMAGHFHGSHHSTRQLIRTCILLEKRSRKHRWTPSRLDRGKIKPSERLGLFLNEARRAIERMTLYVHPYPLERADLMILESSLHEALSAPIHLENATQKAQNRDKALRKASLNEATRYLSEAETIVIGLSRRNRIRLRLARERSKINRARAELETDPVKKKRFVELARYDTRDLASQAEQSEHLVLWRIAAKAEKDKTQALIDDFNKPAQS